MTPILIVSRLRPDVRPAPQKAGCFVSRSRSRRISCKSVRSFGLRPSHLSIQPIPDFAVTPADATATTPVAQSGRPGQPAPATVRLRGSAL
jgi:hypothetical protein